MTVPAKVFTSNLPDMLGTQKREKPQGFSQTSGRVLDLRRCAGQSDRELRETSRADALAVAGDVVGTESRTVEEAIVEIVLPSMMILWLCILGVHSVAIAIAEGRKQVDVGGRLLRRLRDLAGLLQLLYGVAVLDQAEVAFAVNSLSGGAFGVADQFASIAFGDVGLSLEW